VYLKLSQFVDLQIKTYT